MDDLISRQDGIDAFDGTKVDETDCTEYDIGYNDGIDFAVSKLSVLPSAQPKQKKGKWIEEIGMLMCSECGDAWGTEQFDEVTSFNFCPNCGAKMEGHDE